MGRWAAAAEVGVVVAWAVRAVCARRAQARGFAATVGERGAAGEADAVQCVHVACAPELCARACGVAKMVCLQMRIRCAGLVTVDELKPVECMV